jgi:hypothetical protein
MNPVAAVVHWERDNTETILVCDCATLKTNAGELRHEISNLNAGVVGDARRDE